MKQIQRKHKFETLSNESVDKIEDSLSENSRLEMN